MAITFQSGTPSTPPAGTKVAETLNASGESIQHILLYDSAGNPLLSAAAALAAGTAYPTTGIVRSVPMLDNGITLDPQRGNLRDLALLSNAALGVSRTSAAIVNYNWRSAIFWMIVTGSNATGSVNFLVRNPSNQLQITSYTKPIAAADEYWCVALGLGATTSGTDGHLAKTASVPLPARFEIYVWPNGTAFTGNIAVTADLLV